MRFLDGFFHKIIKVRPMTLAESEFGAMVMSGSGIKIYKHIAIFNALQKSLEGESRKKK